MEVRGVKLELEAKLKSPKGGFFSKPSGKLERKTYDDSTERLKVSVRNLRVPDGVEATVEVDGCEIAKLKIENGKGRYDEEYTDPNLAPKLKSDQQVKIIVGSEILLEGDLYID